MVDMAAADQQFQSSQQGERPTMMPEDEIRELERKLAEKKQALAESGAAPREEKEVFREVVREHIAEKVPAAPPPGAAAPPQAPGAGGALPLPSLLTPQRPGDEAAAAGREERLALLVERAMTRSIEDAVNKAALESPYLLDELHDRLTDSYYEKLVQLRKLEAL